MIFLQYLQMKDYINHFTISAFFYKKKSYPKNHEVRDLDKKLDVFTLPLSEFPEQLRIMSLILLYTGINKGKMFLLRNADFYYENEDSWMKVPGMNRSVPIPDILHLLVLKYSEKNRIDIERLLFLNRNKNIPQEVLKMQSRNNVRIPVYWMENMYSKETDTRKNYVKPLIETVLQSRQSGSIWVILQMKQ